MTNEQLIKELDAVKASAAESQNFALASILATVIGALYAGHDQVKILATLTVKYSKDRIQEVENIMAMRN